MNRCLPKLSAIHHATEIEIDHQANPMAPRVRSRYCPQGQWATMPWIGLVEIADLNNAYARQPLCRLRISSGSERRQTECSLPWLCLIVEEYRMSQPASVVSARAPFWRRAFDWWLAQVTHALPPTIFFFVGFNLILWTKRQILADQGVEFTGFLTATAAALLVGKAVLITDNLPFMRRFDGAPLIQPILFKSAIYWLCVLIVRLLERHVHFVTAGGAISDFPGHLVDHFSWSHFLMVQIWLKLLIYFRDCYVQDNTSQKIIKLKDSYVNSSPGFGMK
jgi:hypothetical protein